MEVLADSVLCPVNPRGSILKLKALFSNSRIILLLSALEKHGGIHHYYLNFGASAEPKQDSSLKV